MIMCNAMLSKGKAHAIWVQNSYKIHSVFPLHTTTIYVNMLHANVWKSPNVKTLLLKKMLF